MVKGMWKNSRRMKVLQGLATGRIYTFAEFRDELVDKDDYRARKLVWWLSARGESAYGAKIETTLIPNQATKNIAAIRCVNATEVAQLLARSGGSAVTKKPSKKTGVVVTAMPREVAKKSVTSPVSVMTAKTANASAK